MSSVEKSSDRYAKILSRYSEMKTRSGFSECIDPLLNPGGVCTKVIEHEIDLSFI
jgi:hypothetical protein